MSGIDVRPPLSVFPPQDSSEPLVDRYVAVRNMTEKLCAPLALEDYVVQSMPDVSPTKWHLAHTTWFFETFLLGDAVEGYRPFDPHYQYLFNSYYNAVGPQFPRPRRGVLSRPTLKQVWQYRRHVDRVMADLMTGTDKNRWEKIRGVVELGINHEQQHQELILTDIKHVLSCNPMHPVYRQRLLSNNGEPGTMQWRVFPEQLAWIGHEGAGFAFDNEMPRHRNLLESFQLASRLVTNAEYLVFMLDDGYSRPELWLSAGWDAVRTQGWRAPLYWEDPDGQWLSVTLSGLRPVEPHEPVCHVSFFEADAYARWAGARLPNEWEWETAARSLAVAGNLLEEEAFHPEPAIGTSSPEELHQMFGDVWEWTGSAYGPYPGYKPAAGALGEYNGKFMCNQLVLRGGSCATPRSHIRPTYRNFFPPETRWQFSGIRLARDADYQA